MEETFAEKVKRVHGKIQAILEEEGMVLVPTISMAEKQSEAKRPEHGIITPGR